MQGIEKRLFVVGVGRSGTSLLQSMLACHDKIVMLPETGFIRRYLLSSFSHRDGKVAAGVIKRDRFLSRWENDGVIDINGWDDNESISLKALYEDVSRQYIANSEKNPQYVAEKDPKLIEGLTHLDRFFSEYKVIHIYRDPRDVVLSKNKADWSRKQSLLKKLIANNAQMRLLEIYRHSHEDFVYEVQYEKLLENPGQILRQICNFLNVDFYQEMLNFQDQAKLLISNDEMSWKKETTGPLLTNNMYKWRNEMQPGIARLVERSCYLSMQKGGYISTDKALSLAEKFKICISGLLVDLVSMFYVYKARCILK